MMGAVRPVASVWPIPWMVALFLIDKNRASQGFFCGYILPQGGGEYKAGGIRTQRKRAINLPLIRLLVESDSKTRGVELQDWAHPLFADLLMTSKDTCP